MAADRSHRIAEANVQQVTCVTSGIYQITYLVTYLITYQITIPGYT